MIFLKPLNIRLRLFFETRNFEHIPATLSDFKKPYAELTSAFPEIEIYKKRFRFPHNTPLITDLVTAWGAPNTIKTTWWHYPIFIGFAVILGSIVDLGVGSIAAVLGSGFALFPGPEKKYIWIKGVYRIETVTQLGCTSYYKRAILYWKWTRQENKIDNVPVHSDAPKGGA